MTGAFWCLDWRQYKSGFRLFGDLLQDAEHIPVLPAGHEFSIQNLDHSHASGLKTLVGRRHPQSIAGMPHGAQPPKTNLVVLGNGILNRDMDVRESSPHPVEKG